MRLYFAGDENGWVRIEEEYGSSVTLYIKGTSAQIVSLCVKKEDRNEGIARNLLNAASKLANERGAQMLTAYYIPKLNDLNGFFEHEGFILNDSDRYVSLNTKMINASQTMVKILQAPGISAQQFIPLCRLMPRLWNGLFSALQEKKIPISFNEMQRFDQNISGAVCDRAGRIKAFILCEVCDDAIRVDFADSIDENDNISILSAIRELLIYIKNTSKKVFFLDFYAVGGAVMPLVNKIQDNKGAIYRYYDVKEAIRKYKKKYDPEENVDIVERKDVINIPDWIMELRDHPIQLMLSRKSAWMSS